MPDAAITVQPPPSPPAAGQYESVVPRPTTQAYAAEAVRAWGEFGNDDQGRCNRVAADIRRRAEVGYKRYGTYLWPDNGRDSLVDAYQENLDLVVYLANESRSKEDFAMGRAITSVLRDAIDLAVSLRGLLDRKEAQRGRVLATGPAA